MGHTHEDQMMEVDAQNLVNAESGDMVKLEMSARSVLMASFIVYVVPLIGLFLGYYSFSGMAKIMGYAARADTIGGIAGVTVLLLSFLIMRWYDRKLTKEQRFNLEIVRIVDSNDVC